MPFELKLATGSDSVVPLYGVSEWMCYYTNHGARCPDDAAAVVDECIDVHVECGFDGIVWDCGRATLHYRSDLPNTTQMAERSDRIIKTNGSVDDWSHVRKVLLQLCPLRRAIATCRDRGVALLGRLAMNRHYGQPNYETVTSQWHDDNPALWERAKSAEPIPGKLCYALEEVQAERIEVLLEIQRIGVDALVLDFCRQMPILRYHEALVGPYKAARGVDPRTIDSDNPEDFRDWFQYRADVLTTFMLRLREAVRDQERQLGRPCPIIARIPDSAPWLMLAYGLDVERWFADDLVDATMLSPFPRCREDLNHYCEHNVAMAHRYGKVCIGGVGSRGLIEIGRNENTGFYHEQPVWAMANRQYKAGADAMSLYQSESLCRMDYLKPLLCNAANRAVVAARVAELPAPDLPPDYRIAVDWHTRYANGETLRSGAGPHSL